MAGNTVVLKPSELTPLVGLKIGDVFARAGLPEGVLEIVTGDGSTGAALVEAGVDKIMFTGSVPTGRRVAEAAARKLMPVVLELGGKDPMIVFEDADLSAASEAAVWGAFANSGQACASVERCYVHESIAEEFTRRVVEKVGALRQSDGGGNEGQHGVVRPRRDVERAAVPSCRRARQRRGRARRARARGRRPREGLFGERLVPRADRARRASTTR